ncbi:MAG: asparagine synthase (glutamine-hydrolyzing) [Acidobacteriaceae bacterium]|nr:asparagine synthase (glutamine-hydrolyzing) [Acidobacteriaceae bacterium]MBV9778534.1 asparagine synthase (glutamine-hydrolyzing) [Acidobacteriaceae bacterium]
MCGIAGFVLRQGRAEASDVRAMCDQIRHRGPDDEGIYADRGCGIGMLRLSIIDLNTGHQPISNEDRSVWVVFNGEIYNYQSLRKLLVSKGHRFSTQSDTEVLVHLYEEFGLDGIQKLRGMFAYAIWDAQVKRLLLVRDRFGKKPLYYSFLPEGLFFGSELKCLYPVGVPRELDDEALRLYFQFSYIPDPLTPYKAIRKLAPGGWLFYDSDGSVKQGLYWKLPEPQTQSADGLTEDNAAVRVREMFDQAVRMRMIADVPLGAFLSGGIDSSSVVASMAMQSSERVKTFSIGFEESAFNELPAAALVAKKFNTDHHEIMVRPDAVSLVSKLVHHFDEPFGDSSAIPTFIVSEFAALHVKVALTGDGGDELFAGYDSFFAVDRLRRLDFTPQFARVLLSRVADSWPYSFYGKNYLRMISRPSPLARYFELNYTPYFLRKALLQPDWMLPAESGFLMRTFRDSLLGEEADIVAQAIYFEARAKLTGDMLVKVDRMSMANSLEVRSPLLDHELAEFAMSLPHKWKMRNGRGKQIFLKAVGHRLPSELLKLPKKGFGVPLALWFRSSLRTMLWDHLTSRVFLDRSIVSERFLKHLLKEHDSGRRDNSYWLWMLLMFELWMRSFEDLSATPTHRAYSCDLVPVAS